MAQSIVILSHVDFTRKPMTIRLVMRKLHLGGGLDIAKACKTGGVPIMPPGLDGGSCRGMTSRFDVLIRASCFSNVFVLRLEFIFGKKGSSESKQNQERAEE